MKQAAISRCVSRADLPPSVLWRNWQTEAHLVLRAKPRNHHSNFEVQITKTELPVSRPKLKNPPPPWFWGSTKKLTAGFEAIPGDTVAISFESKLEKTVVAGFKAKSPETVATSFEAKLEKTVATSFDAKSKKTIATGFEAKLLETVATGFEAKMIKTVRVALRPNQSQIVPVVLRANHW
jgi:hypothetical protein